MGKSFFMALAIGATLVFPALADTEHRAISPLLLSELNAWLDTKAEFEKRDSPPHIVFIGPVGAEQLHGVADRAGGRIRGLYDEGSATIYLTDPWSSNNPRDIGVLLHELVHHRQAPLHWYCQEAQEWRAYQIQAQWLTEQGIQDSFYWPAILLQSSCTKRDIHPD